MIDEDSVNKKYKKQLKRLDVNVMERLVTSMYETGRQNKTNISRNSKLAYDKCVLYLKFLTTIDFVKKDFDDNGHEVFDVTPRAISFCKKKFSNMFDENNSRKASFRLLV
jgi:predicted transcriptional regulator